ncbi:MAG: hypothetical protein AB1760_10650 [Pseudomonadota bacterium]
MRRKIIPAIFLFLSAVLATLSLTSCGSQEEQKSGDQESEAALDLERTVVKQIAATGGRIDLETAEGARISVIFPQGSLSGDTAIAITPLAGAPFGDEEVLFNGFDLVVDGTDKGPELKSPALVVMSVEGTLPADAVVASVSEDGGYEISDTEVSSGNGRTQLLAAAEHFSAKIITIPGAKRAKQTKKRTFHWCIKIEDSFSASSQLNYTINVNMLLENLSGKVTGAYKGRGNFTTKSEGGGMQASAGGDLNDITIDVVRNDAPLASLETGDVTDAWVGSGGISMSQGGASGVAQVGGYAAGFSNSESVPVSVSVDENLKVTLTATFPQIGAATFRGYIYSVEIFPTGGTP